MSESNHTIKHNEAKQRYEISVDGREAGYCSYVPRPGGVLDFNHTVVDQAFRGQGLSSPLIRAALDDARANGSKVIPSCSAVQHFIGKNEEYADLVA
ncbi:GNAT family N-acetyltransferase [Corynebacterium suedekumii]|uniref:GNAT family N-acetyltransferase n=1 Tax=Corynebacterium suedekumii TaxID=3049801 RepID=A0ABY8VP05_9CORY|nr:GNAT family N-acetyltransferase [Corynebacterium suedekumii]WIM70525.1 GNAT family N-acetyltransferase [Corynebacterium suedekumii]